MTKRIIFTLCIAASIGPGKLNAQIVPVGALPTYYNGGFAGEAGALRVATFSHVNYARNHVFGSSMVPYWMRGSHISVDHFLKKIGSGVAVTAGTQGMGDHFRNTSMSLAVSPKLSFKGAYTVAPFADFYFARYSYRNSPLSNYSPDYPRNYDYNFFRIKSGFLVNSDKAYIGVSAEVLNRATTSAPRLKDSFRFLTNMMYYFQGGYTFQRKPGSKFSFTPQFVISHSRQDITDISGHVTRKGRDITLVDLNLMFRYKKLITGINSTGLVLGYQTSRFKFQVTNFYSRAERFGQERQFGETLVRSKPLGHVSCAYSGMISLRYVLKGDSEKVRGF